MSVIDSGIKFSLTCGERTCYSPQVMRKKKLYCKICKTQIFPAEMNSVDALDLMSESLKLGRLKKEFPLPLLARLREQIQCHRRGLRNLIGWESL